MGSRQPSAASSVREEAGRRRRAEEGDPMMARYKSESPRQSSPEHDLVSLLRRPPASESGEHLEAVVKQYRMTGEAAAKLRGLVTGPRINILSDLPTDDDAFSFTPFVRTLADIVLSENTETPVAIGLDGAWGTGKTS